MSFTIGGGINLESCYTTLLTSDTNNDGYITQSEFLSYLQSSTSTLTTNQYGSPLTSFSMLPQRFIGLYNFFACGDEFVGCPSVIGIDIRGLLDNNNNGGGGGGGGGGANLSAQETTFLYRLCKDTEETVEEYEESVKIDTVSPTGVPTMMEVVTTTSVPTPSPVVTTTTTAATATTTAIATCPPQYIPNQPYQQNDLVSNDIFDSPTLSDVPYFQCKPFPNGAWCSQAAYEPGVTMNWEDAWELVGVCNNGESVVTTSSVATTTAAATVVATTDATMMTSATTSASTTAATSVTTTVSATTSESSATTPSTTATITSTPTKRPTINPEDLPISGPLPVQFQYEIGNNQNLQSQSILTQSNPVNDMMGYLEVGTDQFVKLIMADTFGGSSVASSIEEADVSTSVVKTTTNNENIRKGRRQRRRNLQVSYNPSSLTINSIQDIACSYPNMTSQSRCQKVTAGVTLDLDEEPPLMTNLKFQSGISRGIDKGLLSFPDDSGIVYVGETKAVQVISELEKEGFSESGSGSSGGGNDGSTSNSNNKWVVPVSVVVAVSLAAILILFAASRFRKRQREGKEFDGAEEVSLEEEGGEVIANDLAPSPTITSYFSNPFKRQRNGFEETIEETPSASHGDSDSDLIDLEQGGTTTANIYAMNQPNEQRRSSKNPFSSSSSSSQSSSSEDMQRYQSKGFPLPSWKEVSEDDLSKSGEVGEMYMRERHINDYRAGVEALVQEVCPELMNDVDGMMAEYEGREAVLIGQLSVMLVTQKEKSRDDDGVKDSTTAENSKSSKNDRLKAVLESGAALADSKSFDESSAAGSSQWSTDDGMSSIDASMSASSSEREMIPDTYAAIGDAALTITDSNLRTTTFIQVEADDNEFSELKLPSENQAKQPQGQQAISKEDLDAAIEAGDWNAVGATASLLARDALERRGSESDSSAQSDSGGDSLSSMDYSDKDRADEFEKLIEAGDWKAVMAIASEFEGAGDSQSLQVSKQSEMDYNDSRRLSSSDMLGNNEALSKRQEIEELVRRVVPDEMENIDEMLFQFKGRENELIMTLQTMEERNQNSLKGSDSSISSPDGSKASSSASPNQTKLRQMPSFQEDVFESDSVVHESDNEMDRQSPRISNLHESSESDSSSSSESEDLSKLIHK